MLAHGGTVIQEAIMVRTGPEPVVAFGLAEDMLQARLAQAATTYTSASSPPLPRARPVVVGSASLTPIFDRVLGKNHLSKGRYEAGTASLLHTHDADHYIVVTAGEGSIRCPTERYRLQPGTVVWIPRSMPHLLAADSDTALELIVLAASGYSTRVVQ